MAKKAFVSLTGGLNNVDRPDTLEEDQLQECVNYEITGVGRLEKRTMPSQYSSALTLLLNNLFDKILFVSQPYYPPNEIDGNLDKFLLFIFGIETKTHTSDPDVYKLQIAVCETPYDISIKDASGDSYLKDLYDSGLVYTSDSNIDISIGDRGVYISDGVNPIHKVSIDSRGEIIASWVGIKAPPNKPKISTELFSKQFDNTSSTIEYAEGSEDSLGGIGLIRCQYTVVSETGQESNPSPASDFINAQYFKIASDGVSDERLIKSIIVSELNIPSVPEAVVDSLKYFKIYYQIIRYSEGVDLDPMEFAVQVDIKNKTTDVTNTDNDYTITDIKAAGDVISYENDTGIPCKVSAINAGVLMVGGVTKVAHIPGDFEYMTPIAINNRNKISVVDAIVKIKLAYNDIKDKDGNEIFPKWSNYFRPETNPEGQTDQANILWLHYGQAPDADYPSRHLRIYDNDLTTPIMVYVPKYNSEILDIYVKIPLLTAGARHKIYLCWNDADKFSQQGNPANNPIVTSGHEGIQDAYNNIVADKYDWDNNIGIHYGRWALSGDDTNVTQNRQQVFQERRVPSAGTEILTVPHIDTFELGDDGISSYDLHNRANTNCHGEAGKYTDPNIVMQSVAPSGKNNGTNSSPHMKLFLSHALVGDRYDTLQEIIGDFGGLTSTAIPDDLSLDYWAGYSTLDDKLSSTFKLENKNYIDIDLEHIGEDHRPGEKDRYKDWIFIFSPILSNRLSSAPNLSTYNIGSRGLAPITSLGSHGGSIENYIIADSFQEKISAFPGNLNAVNKIPDVFNRLTPIPETGNVFNEFNKTSESANSHYSAGAFKPWCGGWSFRDSAVNIGKMPDTGYMHTNITFRLKDLVLHGADGNSITGFGNGTGHAKVPGIYHNSLFHVACGALNDASASPASIWQDLPDDPYRSDVEYNDHDSFAKYLLEKGAPINLDMNIDNFRPTSETGLDSGGNTDNFDITVDEDPLTNTDPTQNMFWVKLKKVIDHDENVRYYLALYIKTMTVTSQITSQIWKYKNDDSGEYKNLFVYLSWDIPNERFAIGYSHLDDGSGVYIKEEDMTTDQYGTTTNIKDSFYNKPLYDIGMGNSLYMTRVLSGKQRTASWATKIITKKLPIGTNTDGSKYLLPLYQQSEEAAEAGTTPGHDTGEGAIFNDWYGEEGQGIGFREGYDGWERTSLSGFHGFYGTTEMTTGKYSADKHFISCIRDNMPRFGNAVGYDYNALDVADRDNNNITIEESVNRTDRRYENMIMWSEINKDGLPDLNYKLLKEPVTKILSAPSFLKFEYSNTFLIFTRNTINRFMLKGVASGWAGSSESLIEEQVQYGLYAPDSLARVGAEIFWFSEEGVVRWNAEGMQNISANVINIPIRDDYIGFYCPVKNQYMLHYNIPTDEEIKSFFDINKDGLVGFRDIVSTRDADLKLDILDYMQGNYDPGKSITYVYDLTYRRWTMFENLNIISSSILNGRNFNIGSLEYRKEDNINLFLTSDNRLLQYPTSQPAIYDDAYIKTKDMQMESGIVKRIKLDFNGSSGADVIYTVKNVDSSEEEQERSSTITDIKKNVWRGTGKLGRSYGRVANIKVQGANEINSILYDISVRGGE